MTAQAPLPSGGPPPVGVPPPPVCKFWEAWKFTLSPEYSLTASPYLHSGVLSNLALRNLAGDEVREFTICFLHRKEFVRLLMTEGINVLAPTRK